MDSYIAAQSSQFEDIWQVSETDWPPASIEDAYLEEMCWTTLNRANSAVGEALSSLTREMSDRWPDHIYYARATFHLTIFGIGEPAGTSELKTITSCLDEALREADPIYVEVLGINVLKSTVIAQAFDQNGALRRLVSTAQEKLSEEGIDLSSEIGLHTSLWWLSIARLKENADREMLQFVRDRRELAIGRMDISKVEIVETDGLFSPAKTSVLFTFESSRGTSDRQAHL